MVAIHGFGVVSETRPKPLSLNVGLYHNIPMSDLSRFVTAVNDWSKDDLTAYNITVRTQHAKEFFGRQPEPIDHLDPDLFSTADPTLANSISKGFSRETYRFLTCLDAANRAGKGLFDFARRILEVLGFDDVRGTMLRTRFDLELDGISLSICDDSCEAEMHVALVHSLSHMILMFVHLEKCTSVYDEDHPEPQLVAKAIAAFQRNNERRKGRALEPLDKMTIPCIAIVGTRPFFYKVPVTQQLSSGVELGTYPPQPTVVTRCAPPFPYRMAEGMVIPEYRRTALEYFNAFRAVAEKCWIDFLVDFP
jgi:hypothetical protein